MFSFLVATNNSIRSTMLQSIGRSQERRPLLSVTKTPEMIKRDLMALVEYIASNFLIEKRLPSLDVTGRSDEVIPLFHSQ